MRLPLSRCAGILVLLTGAAASGAIADPLIDDGYRFAAPVIEGSFVGAPFMELPSPRRIVPPAWGYGTYGIPTVAGIREAPAPRPTLTVIERREPASARPSPRRSGPRILTKDPAGTWTEPPHSRSETSEPRIVFVRVPTRTR